MKSGSGGYPNYGAERAGPRFFEVSNDNRQLIEKEMVVV